MVNGINYLKIKLKEIPVHQEVVASCYCKLYKTCVLHKNSIIEERMKIDKYTIN